MGQGPKAIAATADGSLLVVANTFSGTVTVIDTTISAAVATIPVGFAPFGVAFGPALAGSCAGDCNEDGRVTVDEVILGVAILLGEEPLKACGSFDGNGSGTVTVDELLEAVQHALGRCAIPTAPVRSFIANQEGAS